MSKSISLYEVKQGKKCNMETVAVHTSLQQPWWSWNTIQLKSMYIACNSPQPTSLSTQHQCQLKPSKRGPFWVWVLLSSHYFSSPSPPSTAAPWTTRWQWSNADNKGRKRLLLSGQSEEGFHCDADQSQRHRQIFVHTRASSMWQWRLCISSGVDIYDMLEIHTR